MTKTSPRPPSGPTSPPRSPVPSPLPLVSRVGPPFDGAGAAVGGGEAVGTCVGKFPCALPTLGKRARAFPWQRPALFWYELCYSAAVSDVSKGSVA
jgi:hypothetical protein